MSRVVEFAEAGGPEVLRFKNVDVPEAGPGQVRIRVKAIGLNRAESMWREDKYIEPVKFPARLGYEAVGTVDSVGKRCHHDCRWRRGHHDSVVLDESIRDVR